MIEYEAKLTAPVTTKPFDKGAILSAVGMFLVQQVKERFASRGSSGGVIWPEKRFNDGRSPLTGRTGSLAESFTFSVDMKRGSIVLYSMCPFAHVHEEGMTIEAKKAKALFIPITDRAANSQRYTGPEAAFIKNEYGHMNLSGPMRMASSGSKLPSGIFSALKPGKFEDGVLMVRNDDGEYEPGVPDFIFLKKVNIPKRPMLPVSPREQQAQHDFVESAFLRNNE